MPKITQQNIIDVTPEKFIRACDRTDLHELDLLLGPALAKIDNEEHAQLPSGIQKLSMKQVLEHCLEYGVNGVEGISIEVQTRIREFLNIAGEDNF